MTTQLDIVNRLAFATERLSGALRDMSDTPLEFDDINDTIGSLDGLATYLTKTARMCEELLAEHLHHETGIEA